MGGAEGRACRRVYGLRSRVWGLGSPQAGSVLRRGRKILARTQYDPFQPELSPVILAVTATRSVVSAKTKNV